MIERISRFKDNWKAARDNRAERRATRRLNAEVNAQRYLNAQPNRGRPFPVNSYKDKLYLQGAKDGSNLYGAAHPKNKAYMRGHNEGLYGAYRAEGLPVFDPAAEARRVAALNAPPAATAAPAAAAPTERGIFTKIGRFIMPEKTSAIRAFDNSIAAGAVSAGGAVAGGGAALAGANALERRAPDFVERLGAAWGALKAGGTVAGGVVGANLAHRAVSGLKKLARP